MADPGFDLRGGRGLCQPGRGGRKCRKSLKVLKVKVKVISLVCFGHISIKILLTINREPPGSHSSL